MAEELFNGKDVDVYTKEALKCAIDAVRHANALPKIGDNYELYKSYPIFAQFMQLEGQRAIKLVNGLFKQGGCKVHIPSDDKTDEDERMDRIIDANDSLLENVGILLDEACGIRKRPEPLIVTKDIMKPAIRTAWNQQLHQSGPSTSGLNNGQNKSQDAAALLRGSRTESSQKSQIRLFGSKNMAKPQMKFWEEIDNSNAPFRSKLKVKHNAAVKAQGNLKMVVDGEEMSTASGALDAQEGHPYRYELSRFQPDETDLEHCKPEEPRELWETPLSVVESVEDLEKLRDKLNTEPAFAVDLEHHQYRTFLGLTCLMQISTRTEDFIVDTLELWKDIHILNDPFTNPKILKVFHGSDFDVEWLQRDFGIYIVNMFDTGQAMRLLNLPRFSLAFLIKYYLNKDLDKQYQLADWRIRPLPDDFLKYAREDTHYLLYCYDRLKNDLLDQGNKEKNLLRSTFMRSRDICLKHYKKPQFHPQDYKDLGARSRKTLNPRQEWALREVFQWRDRTGRQADESLRYVLPDHMLLQIADVLPKEMQGILACCNPVPPIVKQELHELHRIILEARDQPLTAKVETQILNGRGIGEKEKVLNPILYTPHDFSHTQEQEEMMPLSQRLKHGLKGVVKTMKKAGSSLFSSLKEKCLVKDSPSLKVFGEREEEMGRKGVEGVEGMEEWMTPYEQYLLARKHWEERGKGEGKRKREEGEEEEGEKKMYSHKDEARRIRPFPVPAEPVASTEDLEFMAPKEKKAKKGSMAHLEEALSKEMDKARKKTDKAKHLAADVKPFDYTTADTDHFFKEKKPKISDTIFDPNRSSNKRGGKKGRGGKRGGKGGRGRGSGSKTMSFGQRQTRKKHQ